MGNLMIGYDFRDYTPTASSSATYWPIADIKLYGRPLRAWHSTVTTDSWIVMNTAATALKGILLVDVNFTACYIQANATDAWGAPSFRYPGAGNLTISKEQRTQRYNVFIPFASLNYAYWRLFIPTQTPVDGASYFSVGTIVMLDNILTITKNPDAGNKASADHAVKTLETDAGILDELKLGDRVWQDTFRWTDYPRANISDIWTINAQDRTENLVLYYNQDNDAEAFVCRRRGSPIEVSYTKPFTDSVNAITFREMR